MKGRLTIYAIISFGFFGCTAKPSPESKVPAEFAKLKNPFPATSDSIATGKKRYRSADCEICHGNNGDGKGFEARNISMNLHDWRDPSAQSHFSDGELFYIMDKGKGADRGSMPAYHDVETPEQIWDMVNYIRTFGTSSR